MAGRGCPCFPPGALNRQGCRSRGPHQAAPPPCRPARAPSACRFGKGAYFIGKVVWAKGYTELLELLSKHHHSAEVPVHLDCYGTGEDLAAVRARVGLQAALACSGGLGAGMPMGWRAPDSCTFHTHTCATTRPAAAVAQTHPTLPHAAPRAQVREEAAARDLRMTFHGAKDHLDESMHDYMVFINPSTSDVVRPHAPPGRLAARKLPFPPLRCSFWAAHVMCLSPDPRAC